MDIEDIIHEAKTTLAGRDDFRLLTLREAASVCVKLSSALHLRWWRRNVDAGVIPSVKVAGKHHVRSDHVNYMLDTLKAQV